jgi:hypothetical protein
MSQVHVQFTEAATRDLIRWHHEFLDNEFLDYCNRCLDDQRRTDLITVRSDTSAGILVTSPGLYSEGTVRLAQSVLS